ncbi:glycoside hydrolase family 5 protein [Actimicrobium sp. CCI2.3]|uniref:glycoside hydrolase family 5 protein n=1 Tax=Actimicrobium sp. CCI2.3 TaxID=3048616 RepID=UPI002AB514BF|nr:glycoside hydrolase family 5 protein [Actimicrobium sp. CCI2.3]MDY7576653.1 glycoside hydrolase family 5 protein [Actimicrobium sp. CCI2.3]MEB0021254.1 glycoside hydrolase family 5 protein [Actimicrobium sp. CCI2.3]
MDKFLKIISKKNYQLKIILLVLLFGVSQFTAAQCLIEKDLKGVNLAGAEFNASKIPGTLNKDYVYPNQADIDYVVALGGNVIRLPFRWERIQPVLFNQLDPFELRNLKVVVDMAAKKNVCVILDIHNYGTFEKTAIGTDAVPVTAFHDLWVRLAEQFSDPDKTAFGLMNEPANMTIALWASTAQSTLSEIRKSGAKNIILVSGGRWSGAHEWFKKSAGVSNAQAFSELEDTLSRTWIEIHQYADSNFSGMGKECIKPDRFENFFAPLTTWAEKNKQKLFLGEFGVPPEENCLVGLSEILNQISNNDVWRGSTYWAAGRWWGNYPFSIQMKNGVEPPQTIALRKYFVN